MTFTIESNTQASAHAKAARTTPPLVEALRPLAMLADAYDADNLNDEARRFLGGARKTENTTPPKDMELYAGRGGKQLLTLENCNAARNALLTGLGIKAALAPLVAIADAYDANELDDEARKHWGMRLEHTNTTQPSDIELYTTRDGKTLTLEHCMAARAALI